MPPKQEKKRDNPFTKLFGDIDELIGNSVKREELVDALRDTINLIREVEERTTSLTKKERDALKSEITSLASAIKAVENSLRESLRDMGEQSGMSLGQAIKELKDELSEIRSVIPTLPDYTDIFNGIESRLSQIRPDSAEEIRNKLELFTDEDEKLKIDAIGYLRKELDELKKLVLAKSSGGGSGITNPIHWARHEAFTMDGVATDVTLTQVIGAEGNACIVRYQGQTLDMDTHYTTNGNKITLVGFTPVSGDIISVTYWP